MFIPPLILTIPEMAVDFARASGHLHDSTWLESIGFLPPIVVLIEGESDGMGFCEGLLYESVVFGDGDGDGDVEDADIEQGDFGRIPAFGKATECESICDGDVAGVYSSDWPPNFFDGITFGCGFFAREDFFKEYTPEQREVF